MYKLQRQGSRVSVSSDPSSVEADSTYDQPKTVLKVTSSPLKRRTQQVTNTRMEGKPLSRLFAY